MKRGEGTVRITGGEFSGRLIRTPGGKTHPMGDRERLAIFNALNDKLPGQVILDVYAGSGALGIEALSRGAEKVVFVDKEPVAISTIKDNLASLGVPNSRSQVIKSAADKLDLSNSFDLILADPPYDKYNPEENIKLASFLKPQGILVLSHPNDPLEIDGLRILKTNKYAKAHITFYQKIN